VPRKFFELWTLSESETILDRERVEPEGDAHPFEQLGAGRFDVDPAQEAGLRGDERDLARPV
jgi:hypothetical protein